MVRFRPLSEGIPDSLPLILPRVERTASPAGVVAPEAEKVDGAGDDVGAGVPPDALVSPIPVVPVASPIPPAGAPVDKSTDPVIPEVLPDVAPIPAPPCTVPVTD